jgi:hypothetical protein
VFRRSEVDSEQMPVESKFKFRKQVTHNKRTKGRNSYITDNFKITYWKRKVLEHFKKQIKGQN